MGGGIETHRTWRITWSNCCRYLALKERENKSPFLKCGSLIRVSDFFSKWTVWKWGGEHSLGSGHLINRTSARWGRSHISDKSCWSHRHTHTPWIKCDKKATSPLGSSSPNLYAQPSHERNIKQTQTQRLSIKLLSRSHQIVQVTKVKKRTSNCDSQELRKEIWWLSVIEGPRTEHNRYKRRKPE